MLSQQATVSPSNSLIDRVLQLRQRLNIDIPLSISDQGEACESSMEMPGQALPTYNNRDWLTWSQSPCGENQPEKD